MIVLCGGGKGGTGKSTLAVNLAVWYAAKGDDVLLLDTDPQGTAANWAARRSRLHPDAPRVHSARQVGDVYDTVADLAGRYQHIVIDAGGYDSEELRTGMGVAHLLIVPVQPSQPDLETMRSMDLLFRDVKQINRQLRGIVIVNQAPTHPSNRRSTDAMETLSGLEYLSLCPFVITSRVSFKDCIAEGLGVLEMTDKKAKRELTLLAQEIGD